MSWFPKLFRSRKEEALTELFSRVHTFLGNEDLQNQSMPEGFRNQIHWSDSVDVVPGAWGEFGRDLNNPVPVNGPIGELLYLSALKTGAGQPIAFQRLGSISHVDVDVFEVVSFDGTGWDLLYFDMYYPRKSILTPKGYESSETDRRRVLIRGVTDYSDEFPSGILLRTAKASESRFGFSIADPNLRRLDTITTSRPDKYRAFVESVRLGDRTERSVTSSQSGAATPPDRVNRRVFQTHKYDGHKPVDDWMRSRLGIICVQSARTIRQGLRDMNIRLVENYWHESIYLTFFLFTLGLMKENFRSDPTHWADDLIRTRINQLLSMRFDEEDFPEITISQAVEAYRSRYSEYWSHRHALTTDANTSELTAYGLHLAKVFTGTRDIRLAAQMVVWSNELAALIFSSIHELARSADQR